MVVELVPVTVIGLALTVECVGSTLGTWKVTTGLGLVIVTLSVVSTAVSVTGSATVSVTVNVVCPLASVMAGDGPVTFAVEDGEVKPTALLATGTPPVASSVTVTVDRSTPSAVATVGAATAVDKLGDGIVATAGGDPSPAGDPLSEAFDATKNGADQKWGWVKSSWLFPM